MIIQIKGKRETFMIEMGDRWNERNGKRGKGNKERGERNGRVTVRE